MKTKFKVIIAVILAVVIGIGSISAYKYITSPKEESIPLETTLEDAAELTTQKMIISDVFRSTKGTIPLLNKNRFLVQYKTTITAGLDVQNAKIKETDDKIKAESDEYGFLENADENAKKVIKGMFENVADEREVVVEFTK